MDYDPHKIQQELNSIKNIQNFSAFDQVVFEFNYCHRNLRECMARKTDYRKQFVSG